MEDQPELITEVHIDGLALLKIVKHCNDNLPNMVSGSLLGLDVNGILEVTYSLPLPSPKVDSSAEIDDEEQQIEVMRLLRDVDVDNNCVGWYQSMYFGTLSTPEIVGYQYGYQSSEELSDNSVVILYDPLRSKRGGLVLKAFRLSDEYIRNRKNKLNSFIRPKNILQELPVKITNSGHLSAFVRCLQDSHSDDLSSEFESLSMANSENTLERHMELLNSCIDELAQEQQRFQQYSKLISKARNEQIKLLKKKTEENAELIESGEAPVKLTLESIGGKTTTEAPSRIEPLLLMGQVNRYCQQVNEHVELNFQKLVATAQSHSS
jgi:translation initiation factor 3 subunit H